MPSTFIYFNLMLDLYPITLTEIVFSHSDKLFFSNKSFFRQTDRQTTTDTIRRNVTHTGTCIHKV